MLSQDKADKERPTFSRALGGEKRTHNSYRLDVRAFSLFIH